MARIDYWQYLLDQQGNPLQYATVRVYLAGTLDEANIYLDDKFGSVTTSSNEDLKTDQYGFIQFWIGDRFEVEGGYDVSQQFKVVWDNDVDSIQEEIDNLYIFTPVRRIITDDTIKGDPSNKDKDKVISNRQGYKWEEHVDSIVPSASPHGLEPVEFFDTDDVKNKVISNKLGYQMYEMAETASIIGVDISAARYHNEYVGSLTASGGKYYTDITHNFHNYFPIVMVSKAVDYHVIKAEKIQAIDRNITRIWLEDNIALRIAIFG
jgi:hypothetical protein